MPPARPWRREASSLRGTMPLDDETEEDDETKAAQAFVAALKAAGARRSTATRLVDMAYAADIELFHTPDREPFAVIPADGHRETWPIRSSGFRLWLRRLFHLTTDTTANKQAVEEALATLESHAQFEGDEQPVHLRLAEWEGRLYLDLCDQSWRAVEITPDDWRVLDQSPVHFKRTRGMHALPMPVRGGALDTVREFLTVDDDGWRLIAAWLVNTLRPDRPFPVLALHGEQGSGKSTQCRMVRGIIDPNTAALRACPREERDLLLAALNGWIVAFDNVSKIPEWLSDALCRVSTGAGFGTRQLYTDSEEFLINAKRPILLNSIEEVAVRGDLVDRTITVTVPVMETARRTEEDLWRAYDLERPAILGALLDVAVGALKALPRVHPSRLPRMADFGRWVTAAEPSLGWAPGSFLEVFAEQQGLAVVTTLESSLIPAPLRALLHAAPDGRFEGRVSDLLAQLRNHVEDRVLLDRAWPRDAIRLSGELRRLAPALRRGGRQQCDDCEDAIQVKFPKRTGRSRRVVLYLLREEEDGESSSRTSSSSQPNNGGGGGGDVGDDGDVDPATLRHGTCNVTAREPGEDDVEPEVGF
jgi:energy-coupling factor transporter ATP-binding protein EcfA2